MSNLASMQNIITGTLVLAVSEPSTSGKLLQVCPVATINIHTLSLSMPYLVMILLMQCLEQDSTI